MRTLIAAECECLHYYFGMEDDVNTVKDVKGTDSSTTAINPH